MLRAIGYTMNSLKKINISKVKEKRRRKIYSVNLS